MSVELGVLLAGISGFAFSLGDVSVRAASTKLTPKANLLISLLVGSPFGALMGLLSREALPSSAELIGLYSLAGLLNFVAGRFLFYLSIAWAGASTSSVVTSLAVPLGALFAWILLGETPRIGEIFGLIAVSSAVVLASFRPSGTALQGGSTKAGVAAGLGASVAFALSSVVVRVAGSLGGPPIWGMVIAYLTSIPFAIYVGVRDLKRGWDVRAAGIMSFAAVSTAAAQIAKYASLTLITVAESSIMIGLFPIYTTFLAYFILRRRAEERPGFQHVLAALIAAGGVAVTVLT